MASWHMAQRQRCDGLRTTWQQLHAVCLFVDGADSSTVDAMLSESQSSSGDSYPAMQLGDLEIRAWAAIAAGDLRSARQHLNRASAMLDREGARGVLDHSGNDVLGMAMARDGDRRARLDAT